MGVVPGPVVFWLCGGRPRLFRSWPPTPPPTLFGFFISFCVRVRLAGRLPSFWQGCAPACPECLLIRPFRRLCGCDGPLFLAGRLRAGRGGPSVSYRRVTWVSPLVLPGCGVAHLGGVGAQLRGCATGPPAFLLSLWPAGVRSWVGGLSPLPYFFGGGVSLFLPLPSLGWCTHWSANGVPNWVAVGVVNSRGPCPGSVRRVHYIQAWAGGPSCSFRLWFCRLGGCASRFRGVMGKGGGVL